MIYVSNRLLAFKQCIVVLLVVIVFFADFTIGNDKYVFTGVHIYMYIYISIYIYIHT